MFGRGFNEAISLVLYYIDDEYRKTHPNLFPRNKPDVWLKAIRIAKENGLLYYFAKRVAEEEKVLRDPFEKIVEQEERNFIKLKQTLEFINSLFGQEGFNFMFIKLYRSIPYTPRDVDILIRKEESHQVFMALKRRNIKLKFNSVETHFEEKDLLKVDLYKGFHYLTLDFLDDEFLWKNPRTANICGIKCFIPSYEADFLSLIIHSLLGHRYLSLLDFLYAKLLLNSKLNFDEVLSQSKKYGWDSTLLMMISIIKDIYQELYLGANIAKPINFPYVFPPGFILKVFQGFSNMPISMEIKLPFIFSTLVDKVFHMYQILSMSTSLKVPDEAKDMLMKAVYKVRSWSGDYK